jgi:hypothetical protein
MALSKRVDPYRWKSLLSTSIRKRGRPAGSSQYARGDEHALERMHELVREGQPVAAAAQSVVIQMKVPGSNPAERLRKKFTRYRTQIAARVAAHSKPEMPRTRVSGVGTMLKQAQDAAAFLKTRDGKILIEHARWVANNKPLLLDAVARVRSLKR